MASIDTDDGQITLLKPVIEPRRQLAALKPDAHSVPSMLLDRLSNSLWRGISAPSPYNLAGFIDDADRGLLQGHIETIILMDSRLRHGRAPLALMGTSTL